MPNQRKATKICKIITIAMQVGNLSITRLRQVKTAQQSMRLTLGTSSPKREDSVLGVFWL